jgi:HD-GYP domain-containing protein (c-di-GMP phosphodiesterase class II)
MGYRTRSLLAVPMRNHEGEIIGVIQLINRKRSFDARLRTPTAADRHVISFTAESERVLDAFAGQAAVVLDNRLLLQNIERLFEGFVRASVTAIEARDPTTSGHSARVAELTVRLANEISTIAVGRWKDVAFNEQQIREIRYAGLLHDFGKIGVRENVLVKARKLYDWQLDLIRLRFAYASKALEADYYRRRLDALLEGEAATPLDLDAMKASHHRQTHQLDEDLAAIVAANAPDVVDPALVARIAQARQRSYPHADGQDRPLIEEDELFSLSIRAGSLTVPERREIESHVAHTFRFLSLMPWTRPLRQLPLIAGSHHEKLDGSGYPRGLKGDEIPLQSRIMTIADIYDALTAADRPYRPAMPPTQALNILDAEAAAGRVDADLLEVFVQQRVYERPIR